MDINEVRREYKCVFTKTKNKFIILEEGVWSGKQSIKMSVVNNNEFGVIAYDLYCSQICDILIKLQGEYSKIFVRGITPDYVICNIMTPYFIDKVYSIHRMDDYIREYLRINRRLDLLGAYIELCKLEYNERLLDGFSL